MYISSYRTDWIHISTVLSAPIDKIIERTINELDEGDTIKDVCLVVSFNCFRTETPNKYHVAWRVFKTTMRRPNGEIHQLKFSNKMYCKWSKTFNGFRTNDVLLRIKPFARGSFLLSRNHKPIFIWLSFKLWMSHVVD